MRRSWFLGGLAGLALCVNACNEVTAPPPAEDPPTFQFQWGWIGVDPGRFIHPRAIDIGPDGTIYVVDDSPRVQKFAPDGTFLASWGFEDTGLLADPFHRYLLGAMAVGVGNVYVADLLGRLYHFTTDGDFLGEWRVQTSMNGLAVDGDGFVYVSSGTLQKRTPDGTLVAEWSGIPGGALAIGRGPTLYLLRADSERDGYLELWKIRSTGSVLWKRVIEGDYHGGLDIAVGDGVIYTATGFDQPVREFTTAGIPLSSWTETDSNHEPVGMGDGVVVDDRGDIYVTDYSQNRVVKFAYP